MHLARPIHRYGILLRPVTAADLEQVRLWRNAAHVRSKMEFQTEISPDMHAAWWSALDPATNHYYIVEHRGQGIGVIHAKDIDWGAGTAETGIFIGEVDFLDTFVPVLAVLALMDDLFEASGMQRLQAKVKADEPKVVAFNRQLGYQIDTQREGFLLLTVDAAQYQSAATSLRRWGQRFATDTR